MAGGVANIHIIYVKNKFNYLSPVCLWRLEKTRKIVKWFIYKTT